MIETAQAGERGVAACKTPSDVGPLSDDVEERQKGSVTVGEVCMTAMVSTRRVRGPRLQLDRNRLGLPADVERTLQQQRNTALCNDVSLHSQNDGSELTDLVGSGRQPRRWLGGPEPVPISARRCGQNDHQVRGRGRRDLDPPRRRPGDL